MDFAKSAFDGFMTIIGVNHNVDKVFDQHHKDVERTKSELIRQIDEWGKNLIEEIKKYMEAEKARLDRHYNNCLKNLESSRVDYKNAEQDCKNRRSDGEMEQLLKLCRDLKFELATIEPFQKTEIYVGVQLKGEYEDQTATTDQQLFNSSHPSTQTGDFYVDDPSDMPSGQRSLTDSQRHSNLQQTNQQVAIQERIGCLSSCPRCLMIFPPHLNKDDRILHITAHDS